MKSLMVTLGMFVMLMVSSATAQDQKEAKWFDMEHCAICQNMAGMQEAMAHVHWESHMLDNGVLMVTTIPDSLKQDWEKAMKGVEATIAKAQSGEPMELCGFCQSMGRLMQAGVKRTDLETAAGLVTLLTSDDPEVVKMIHEHAKRSMAEHEKMMKAMNGDSSHHHDDDHGAHGKHRDHDKDGDHDEHREHDGDGR